MVEEEIGKIDRSLQVASEARVMMEEVEKIVIQREHLVGGVLLGDLVLQGKTLAQWEEIEHAARVRAGRK